MDIQEAIARLAELKEAGWTNVNDYYRPALIAILEFLVGKS